MLENEIKLTPTLEAACQAFQAFVEPLAPATKIAALHDSDADGVTAGVVWQQAFERAGFTNAARIIPDRERNAWTPANRERVRAAAPERLFVLELGSQSEPVLSGVPTCFIDNHYPEGVPAGDTLISAYTWQPVPNTSLLVWQLCQTMADIADLDWIAAIGRTYLRQRAYGTFLGLSKGSLATGSDLREDEGKYYGVKDEYVGNKTKNSFTLEKEFLLG